jgi:hypothetical protein
MNGNDLCECNHTRDWHRNEGWICVYSDCLCVKFKKQFTEQEKRELLEWAEEHNENYK